jgi:hypothetical protein
VAAPTPDEAFSRLLGRQPTDAERQRLWAVRDALGLGQNDALWLVLIALEHYQTLYEAIPDRIAAATAGAAEQARSAADTAAEAAAKQTQARMAAAVAAAATKVARQTTGIRWALVVAGAAAAVGLSAVLVAAVVGQQYWRGFEDGQTVGELTAADRQAAASWANTPEGAMARKLADAGALKLLVDCSGKGWKVQKQQGRRACLPAPGVDGWWLSR